MKVSELIQHLQQLDPGMTVINVKPPVTVFVDNRTKPGTWHQQANEICQFPAVKL